MVLLSLIPQIHFWLVRGKDWNGVYVSSQTDEPLYSAYINALIDGRTRKNDPFGGKDDSPERPLPESIFSIQFVPAYGIALLARTFGLSASTAFIVLTPVAALLASLSVFGLVNFVTGDHRLAAAGTLFVLCLGGVVAKFGLFGTFIDIPFPILPFLRRYEPSLAFPFFFLFQLLVWHALTGKHKRTNLASAIGAGLTLAVLVFSYVYLWTSAAAWLACIGALWLLFRPADLWRTLAVLMAIGIFAIIALLPYIYMLTQRAATMDEQLIFIPTHNPDLLRVHEILGVGIFVSLIFGVWRRKIERSDPRVICAASLALLPFVVFNQQILTGKTMQVFHFETYVVNYSTMVGLLITMALFLQPVSSRLLIWMVILSIAWGLVAVGLPARLDSVPSGIARDKIVPVFLRLKELSRQDGTIANLRTKGETSIPVFSPDVSLTKWLPTWTAQGTLLDQTGVDCGTRSPEERKQLFYLHLYYAKVEPETLYQALTGTLQPSRKELTASPNVIFGQARIFPELSSQFHPVEPEEIEREVHIYRTYFNSFSREEAFKRPVGYAIVATTDNFDFSNIDRWYERDAGERFGDYILYRLKLRD